MKRPVITAEILQNMLGGGPGALDGGALSLPADALLTPLALDLARQRGVVPVRPAGAARASQAEARPAAGQAVAPVNRPVISRAAEGGEESPFASVREAVLNKLPEDLRTSPLVDGLIRKAVLEGTIKPNSPLGPSPLAGEVRADSVVRSWRSAAGGVIRIDSRGLPWRDFTDTGMKNVVNIADVIGAAENAPLGAGYLEWENSGFDWRLDYAEVDVVLEGELHITTLGETLKAYRGDVIFVPKGTSLRFSSPGYVKFVYVTWPADWSGA